MDSLNQYTSQYPFIETVASIIVLLLVAFLANFLVKKVLLRIVDRLLSKTPLGRDREVRAQNVIERLANIVPAVVISSGIVAVPHLAPAVVTVVKNVGNAFVILTIAMAITASLDIGEAIYRRRPQASLKPIKGYVQIVKIAVYAIAAILIIATLIDRSPLILLSGLGAMAAVLILVFQDTLLSLVAGIQISSTDMVRVGDWIEMPSLDADGDVTEISLYTVRVQNWDKTISSIPIRKLVTESFKNWRGMSESGGRRIKRALYLDQTSIRFLSAKEIEKLRRFRRLESYLDKKESELKAWNEKLGKDSETSANARRLTNVGTSRAYVEAYLKGCVANFPVIAECHKLRSTCGVHFMLFKGRHFDRSVILLCVRWYLAYGLSLRDLKEMMGERGISIDHSTIHRWVVYFSPVLLKRFNRRKRAVCRKWHMDETYIKVRGQWMYLYRAIDSVGDTIEFFFSEHRDLPAAKRFMRKALARHGRPDRIIIDGSQTNREAIVSCDAENRLRDRSRRVLTAIRIRSSKHLNNRIEQDHRRIKRRVRPMLGFKSFSSAAVTLSGIEMVHMMRKRQGRFAFNPAPSLKEQFETTAA